MTDAEKIEALTRALELAAGALNALVAQSVDERAVIRFNGEWEYLGAHTIGAILAETSDTLGKVKGLL